MDFLDELLEEDDELIGEDESTYVNSTNEEGSNSESTYADNNSETTYVNSTKDELLPSSPYTPKEDATIAEDFTHEPDTSEASAKWGANETSGKWGASGSDNWGGGGDLLSQLLDSEDEAPYLNSFEADGELVVGKYGNRILPEGVAGSDNRVNERNGYNYWEHRRSYFKPDEHNQPKLPQIEAEQDIEPVFEITDENYRNFRESVQLTSSFEKAKEEERLTKKRQRVAPTTTDHNGTPLMLSKQLAKEDSPQPQYSLHDWSKEVVRKREAYQKKRYESGELRYPSSTNVSEFTVFPANESSLAALHRADERRSVEWERADGKMSDEELRWALQNGAVYKESNREIELRQISSGHLSLDELLSKVETAGENSAMLDKRSEAARDLLLKQSIAPVITDSRAVYKAEEMMRFLARFKWANTKTMAALVGGRIKTTSRILLALTGIGLVRFFNLVGMGRCWVLTKAGIEYLELEGTGVFNPPRGPQDISYALIPHQTIINFIAARVIAGSAFDVLGIGKYSEWPCKNRLTSTGRPRWGEEVVAEVEIMSALSRFALDRRNDLYSANQSVDFLLPGKQSPEFTHAEYWALVAPPEINKTYHIPDLVISRPRNDDGSPESLAVEVEIGSKVRRSIEDTLRTYLYDKDKYKKVIWVARSKPIAAQLERVAKMIGLYQEGLIDIVPIMTEDGILDRGRATWMI